LPYDNECPTGYICNDGTVTIAADTPLVDQISGRRLLATPMPITSVAANGGIQPVDYAMQWLTLAGTYSPSISVRNGLSLSLVSKMAASCGQNVYCAQGTSTSTVVSPSIVSSNTQACMMGYLCGPTSSSPTGASPCPPGSYCPQLGTLTPCPSGHYCPGASEQPIPCPLGRHQQL
jgi:hypothetical protein